MRAPCRARPLAQRPLRGTGLEWSITDLPTSGVVPACMHAHRCRRVCVRMDALKGKTGYVSGRLHPRWCRMYVLFILWGVHADSVALQLVNDSVRAFKRVSTWSARQAHRASGGGMAEEHRDGVCASSLVCICAGTNTNASHHPLRVARRSTGQRGLAASTRRLVDTSDHTVPSPARFLSLRFTVRASWPWCVSPESNISQRSDQAVNIFITGSTPPPRRP